MTTPSPSVPPPSEPNPPSPPGAYAAFGIKAFRRFALGMLLVQIFTAGQSVAIAWEMYVRTDDPFALAMVGLVQAIPMLLFTLPAGYLADRINRRTITIAGMSLTALASIGLSIFSYNEGSITVMYVLLFFDSAALYLTVPARTAMVPQLVPAHLLETALKWRSSLWQLAAVVGPAIGGFVIGWSVPAAYLLSAASEITFLFLLLTIPVPSPPRDDTPKHPVVQVLEGLRFVWNRKVLLGTISLDLFAVLLGGAVYLLPIYARDVIDLEGTGLTQERALGWLRAAPAVGAVIMAVIVAHAPPIKRAGRTMLWSVVGFGIATIIFGVSTNLWLSIIMLALTGAFDQISVVVRHTLVQVLTPDAMRGRVTSVNAIFIGSSNELGGFRAGAVARLIGPVQSVVVGGVGTLLVVAMWAGLFPNLRRFGALTEVVEPDTPMELIES